MKTKRTQIVSLFLLSLLLSASMAFAQSGTWTKKANSVKGTWSITDKGGKKTLSLKGFKTATAPDLKIFLSPQTASKLSSKTALKGAVLVSKLKSAKGDQSYALPAGVDLSKYKSLIIHCEKFTKLWGAATL